jgi:hypothetical protein
MTAPRLTGPSETTLTQDLLYATRYYLGGRRGLIILAAVAVIAGLALNWSWLVAAGIGPILLGVLPCLAMCALGLCMHRAGSKSCAASSDNPEPDQAVLTPGAPPASRLADAGLPAVRGRVEGSDHG